MLLTSALTLAGISVVSKAYWNTFQVELKHVRIHTPRNIHLEQDLKILHLTDVHVERLSVSPEKIFDLIGDETFDFIALTGDYLDKVSSIDQFITFLEKIVQIPNRHGIFAVWGNHDWVIANDLPRLKARMENLGVQVMCNESITITSNNTPIHIIGIDDHFSGHSNIDKAYENVPSNGYKIVLTHDPLIMKDMLNGFNYLLCGHLHAGQLFYPLPMHSLRWGIKPLRKYLVGLQQHAKGQVYISGGLGQTGANLRLGCRPEITIHTIDSPTQGITSQAV